MNIILISLEAIEKIITQEAYTDEVIEEYLNKFEMTKTEHDEFINIVEGVILNLLTLEYYLSPYLNKKRYKSWVRPLLYLAAYKIYFLDEDEELVLSESLEIAKIKDRFLSSLIRIILEKFIKNPIRSIDELDDLNRLSIKYSYPSWLVSFLLKDYSFNTVDMILKNKRNNKMWIRVNGLKSNIDEVKNILDSENIKYETLDDLNNGLIVGSEVADHYLINEGLIVIEDRKSQLIAEYIKGDNLRILDVFPAISNSSNYIYELNNTAIIDACEASEDKIVVLKKQSRQLGTRVNYHLIHPLSINESIKDDSYDVIIANVPSSGLGVINQKVDLKYHLNLESINTIIDYQEKIIYETFTKVKKGGYYIYATDSINSDENEKQIAKLIKLNPEFEIISEHLELPLKSSRGFYICKLRRT